MELIDIVDEHGKPTGIVLDKDEAHEKNLLHNEVGVFVINKNREVLIKNTVLTNGDYVQVMSILEKL